MTNKTNLFTESKNTKAGEKKHPFDVFLSGFIPEIEKKSKQLNLLTWILETTGSQDAAELKAEFDEEFRLFFQSPEIYQKLLEWEKDPLLKDQMKKRELDVLIRAFKQNQIPKSLIRSLAQKESKLAQSYANFRPEIEGKKVSENEIRNILKEEENPEKRKKAWEASKEIGAFLAPQILEIVHLRNEAAHSLGYSDYFQMQLELQEVEPKWLLKTFESLNKKSESAFEREMLEISKKLASRFKVSIQDLGPWSWSEPFGQEDPTSSFAFDDLVKEVDFVKECRAFYERMGIDVSEILKRSDLFEREGKNQHAFCFNLDRKKDIRTLNNLQPTLKWLEVLLHELGHAIYELGFDENLPWVLREPPHMITTEAMALLAGRQAYKEKSLAKIIGSSKSPLLREVEKSLSRRQLIFSRWVLVMTYFESELYKNPTQDLNALWWSLVEKYQKIKAPEGRKAKADWASKYHMGLAPVYYFSYLLGEMFASQIEEALQRDVKTSSLDTLLAGNFLNQKLFYPANRMSWSDLVCYVTGHSLAPDAWVKEFTKM